MACCGWMKLLIAALFAVAACSSREPESKAAPRPTPPDRYEAPPMPPEPAAPPEPPKPACDPAARTVCVGDTVVECVGDGSLGKKLTDCPGRCTTGACADTCAIKDVELIYVVDSGHNLMSFDPRKLPGDPFNRVGKLTCDPASRPFSMAVDRQGIAWVLYNSGKLYRVSIVDGHCSAAISTTDAPRTFGMGFASDAPNSTTEKLFVAANDDSQMFAQLDTSTSPPRWTPIAPIKGEHTNHPELTGTGDGKLFGYFPEAGVGFVQELDRASGALIGPRRDVGAQSGRVRSFAFAHWGGVFYVFVSVGDNSAVHAINRKTGKSEVVRDQLPERIVGAGVSTCAPELERAPENGQ